MVVTFSFFSRLSILVMLKVSLGTHCWSSWDPFLTLCSSGFVTDGVLWLSGLESSEDVIACQVPGLLVSLCLYVKCPAQL